MPVQVPSSDYAAVMVTAAAEVPAVAWAALMSKGFGGRTALTSSLLLGAVCLLPLLLEGALQGGAAAAAADGDGTGWRSSLTGVVMQLLLL